jgi:uncharacterized OsmC-like protein
MSEPVSEFTISIDQVADYEFRVNFLKEGLGDLTVDEGPPLGKYAGPSPSHLLASAIGACLNASLLFCARKARVDVKHLHGEVKVQTIRNEERRLRIGKVEVTIDPDFAEDDRERAGRCVELFENFCIVTESVRAGIPVDVRVKGYE